MISRRGLLLGAGATFLAAPAIVKASSLMPISAKKLIVPDIPAGGEISEWEPVGKYIYRFKWSVPAPSGVGRFVHEEVNVSSDVNFTDEWLNQINQTAQENADMRIEDLHVDIDISEITKKETKRHIKVRYESPSHIKAMLDDKS